MNHRFRHVPRQLALCAALALVAAAHASDAHGDGHGHEPPAKASVKLTSKADLKTASQVEGKGEPKADGRTEARGEPRAEARSGGKAAPGKAEAAAAADAKSAASVSMAELRDLIDQKIAEVRAQQETAAVLKVANRAPTARPKRNPALVNAVYNPAAGAESAGNGNAGGGEGALRPVVSRAPRVAARGDATALRGVAVPERAGADGHDLHWEYGGATGPDTWGSLKPEFKQCLLGKRQSPIDIRDGIRVQLEPIQFDYRPTPFTVVDNGHTVQVNVQPGNSITVSGRRYELVQFHFHRPSEERINGRQYEMVAHLVHKDPEGRLAVVAVLMDQGKAHPMVQLVWNSLPLERNTEQASPVQMDLNQMLPDQRQYYTYMGSLTTPPCTEGVLWMVMKQPATMTPEQIAIFARLYPMNARPVQSASNRLIKDGQ